MIKKICKNLILTILIITSFSMLIVVSADDLEKQEENLKEAEDRLKNLDSSHNDVSNQKNKIVKKIRSLESTVKSIEGEIVVLVSEIGENETQITLAKEKLVLAKDELKETNDTLDKRIKVMYINGTIGYIEVLLESRSFEDLLMRIDMLSKIIKSDTDLIEEMEVAKANVEVKKETLESEKVSLTNLQTEKTIKQDELKVSIISYENEKRELETNLEALEVQIDDTNKDAEAITLIIKDIKLREKYVGGIMAWPVPGHYSISSPFGMRIHPILKVNKMHTGTDIRVKVGTNIVAAQEGTIIWSNWLGGYGKAVMVDHGGGIVTLYAHNSAFKVKKGEIVEKGQLIALSGNTGNSTGPHLHFEVRVNGEFVNPMEWITGPTEF